MPCMNGVSCVKCVCSVKSRCDSCVGGDGIVEAANMYVLSRFSSRKTSRGVDTLGVEGTDSSMGDSPDPPLEACITGSSPSMEARSTMLAPFDFLDMVLLHLI
jgi:hypothetical protein